MGRQDRNSIQETNHFEDVCWETFYNRSDPTGCLFCYEKFHVYIVAKDIKQSKPKFEVKPELIRYKT